MSAVQVDISSLTDEQLLGWESSPMSEHELAQLDRLERGLHDASLGQYAAELQQGKSLLELKHHPRCLWQRDEMFRTKTGGWQRRRSWDAFVKAYELADSGADADRLIAQWLLHERTLGAAQRLQQEDQTNA